MVRNYHATTDASYETLADPSSDNDTLARGQYDYQNEHGQARKRSMNRATTRSSRSRLLSDASSPVDLRAAPIGLDSLAETAVFDEDDEDDEESDSLHEGLDDSSRHLGNEFTGGNSMYDLPMGSSNSRSKSMHFRTWNECDGRLTCWIPDIQKCELQCFPQTMSISLSAVRRLSILLCRTVTDQLVAPRMWTLSLLFAVLGSSTNLFFSLRYPSISITPVIALILVHPIGKGWDLLLKRPGDPEHHYLYGLKSSSSTHDTPIAAHRSRWDALRLWLSQGKWNEKEHACVYISSNVSFGFAFATDVIVEQHKFYKQEVPIMYQILLTISSQILGYAFAGITRRYLVRPPSMVWPGILASTAMFTTLHKREMSANDSGQTSRLRFFVLVWAAGFAWYFLPGLLIPALGAFNVITWFAPDNVVVANLFGIKSGLGLFPLTFDWAYIAYIGSPLLTPWWAAANVLTGVFIVMWLLAPVLYYSNVLYSAYMPILSSNVYDNTGEIYDVSKILTTSFRFDRDAYIQYSPIYLPITYVLSYAIQFAGLAALVSHTCCWHGRDIIQQTKDSLKNADEFYRPLDDDGEPISPLDRRTGNSPVSPTVSMLERRSLASFDIHNRLMEHYSDAPLLWYLACLIGMLAIAMFTVEAYPTLLPWYGVLLALTVTTVMFLPTAIVMAITNQHISLYLISQIICGLVFPGRPVANMIFVTYCYISSAQGIKFASDLKLGHYMKLPPKLLFKVQVIATLVSSMTQIGVLNWMFTNIKDLCQPDAMNGFSCPIARVHFNGSILWGVVGPSRFFGSDALYRHLIWAFPLGFLAPVAVWHLSQKKRALKIWSYVNFPVLFGTLSWMPPATGLNFSIWALICFIFNYVVKKRAFSWWSRYTMTLSAALDFGLASGLVVIFFVFLYPGWMTNFKWWGTEVYKQGCDWKDCSYLSVPPGQHFGP